MHSSGSHKVRPRGACAYNDPQVRILFDRAYARWTVQILPQCFVKTFRTRKEAEAYATHKKQQLSDAPPSEPTVTATRTEAPVIEV